MIEPIQHEDVDQQRGSSKIFGLVKIKGGWKYI